MPKFETLTHQEKLDCIANHIKKSSERLGFPTPSPWVAWLLGQYDAVTGSRTMVPHAIRELPFNQLTDVEKVAALNRTAAFAQQADSPAAEVVPTPWVEWLLTQYLLVVHETPLTA